MSGLFESKLSLQTQLVLGVVCVFVFVCGVFIGYSIAVSGPMFSDSAQVGVAVDESRDSNEVRFRVLTAPNVEQLYVLSDDVPYSRFSSDSISSGSDVSGKELNISRGEYERFLISGDVGGVGSVVRVNVSAYDEASFSVIGVVGSNERVVRTYEFSR